MFPSPLHPAIVHFPVVLAFLLPLFVGGAFWAVRHGANMRRAWMLPVASAVALSLSAFAAVQTGGAQSERVERIVSERTIESHEEMAEAFFAGSAAVVIIALAGFVGGAAGRTARVLTGVGALALVGLVIRVGHSGGQLVYRYGAAAAYTTQTGSASAAGVEIGSRVLEHSGDTDRR
jgi:uncharacterized membrane protein